MGMKGRRWGRSWSAGGSLRTMMGAGIAVLQWAVPTGTRAQTPLEGIARLSVVGQEVEHALQQLRRSAGISLVYSPDLLPRGRAITCACQELTVKEALERILAGTDLTYRATGSLIRIVPRSPDRPGPGLGCIVGRVLDAGGMDPVVNAMIQLEDGADGEQDETEGDLAQDLQGGEVLRGHPAEHRGTEHDPGQDVARHLRHLRVLHEVAGAEGEQQDEAEGGELVHGSRSIPRRRSPTTGCTTAI